MTGPYISWDVPVKGAVVEIPVAEDPESDAEAVLEQLDQKANVIAAMLGITEPVTAGLMLDNFSRLVSVFKDAPENTVIRISF